jgi:hypothetical protein
MVGMPMALVLLAAQAPSAPPAGEAPAAAPAETQRVYGPKYDPPKPKPKPAAAPAPDPVCQSREEQGRIIVCAQRPQGYRLNPDIMEAKRLKRSGGRPTQPGPIAMKDNSCQVVGPAGCFNAGINLVAAALTAATMVQRAIKGENVGKMFITDPQTDEYHLYLRAKAEREAREAEARAKVVAEAAQAKAAAEAKAKAEAAKVQEPQSAQPSRE